MEVDSSAVLEAQGKAHPELAELIDQLQKHAAAKLYHQLTQTLLQYLSSPAFSPGQPSAASELLDIFNGFIRAFESKLDKVRWVQVLSIVTKPQTPDVSLDLIAPFEKSMSGHRDSKYMWLALKAEKLTLAGRTDEAKELLDGLGKEIDDAYEVDALIQSQFHKTQALLWKHLGRPQDFYKSSILYLAFTPLGSISPEERPQLAFEIGVAALVAEEEFNFGELVQQELLASLDGSPHAWLKDLLHAFGEGDFELFDGALAKHRAHFDASPELARAEVVLRQKMCGLALVELAFKKPKKQRRLSFEEIAQHCRVGPKEVEHLLMRTMCANLIKGKIDEVAQVIMITWVKPRILDLGRIDRMRERMDDWAVQTGLLVDHLEEQTPELLVS